MADICVLPFHSFFFSVSTFLAFPIHIYILGIPKSAIRDGEGGLLCDFILSSLSLLPLGLLYLYILKRALLVLWFERELYKTRPLALPPIH